MQKETAREWTLGKILVGTEIEVTCYGIPCKLRSSHICSLFFLTIFALCKLHSEVLHGDHTGHIYQALTCPSSYFFLCSFSPQAQ